jgi:preprotein translocase subunit SecA
MFKNLLNTLAGNPLEREIKRYRQVVDEINALEPRMQAMSNDDLRNFTGELRERVAVQVEGIEDKDELKKAEREALNEVLPEAFAAVREASRRAIGMRHFDVQLIGGMVLHEGKIAEMKTGEGKTLVASLPLYLNALAGRGAHLVTVNDYLVQRDGGWMGPIFHLLGMSMGAIGKEQFSAIYDPDYVDPAGDLEDERLVHWRPTLRNECYQADIVYGTSSEFGFDYLRDHTVIVMSRTVQNGHAYAIVDEADSVLIDSARTPLIISGPAGVASSQYTRFAKIVESARLRRNTTDVEHGEDPDGDYILDDRTQSVSLTDRGTEKIEAQVSEVNTEAGQGLYDPQFYELVHYLENAMKAKYVFQRDKDYIVQGGHVILVDQTTGRPMPSRRYSEGLHQAIEAKEGVEVKREDVTIATITVQNYFRLYDKLGGMTGTAITQAEEFDEVYKLDVVAIPTNVEFRAESGDFEVRKQKIEGVNAIAYWKPGSNGQFADYYKRVDYPDQVYVTINGKFQAVAEEIKELHDLGRPVLVGTGSVEASEELSRRLKQMGLAHEVLNAKHHEREALVIAQAGRPAAITISTSMAGRGTDIVLGGNPEGLASKMLAEECFALIPFREIVTDIVNGNLDAARRKTETASKMEAALVDWIAAENEILVRKASVEDIQGQVIADIREDANYAHLPFDSLMLIVRNLDLAQFDQSRHERARQIADDNDIPLSIMPEIEYRLNEYRSLKGLLGQNAHIDVLTRRLFEQHYNARAAIVRAVLANNVDEARSIIGRLPALPETLISNTQSIREQCGDDRQFIWERGGLHVIGTERHESRRIDDQLRGRAARQGDPGSSRFYLSLEDDLMIRFGGDRAKKMMERLNVPEDMPISANILSGVIEGAQGKFETYNFEIRKNLIEYDEAVNRQRQIVYDERTEILGGSGGELDEQVRTFISDTLERVINRYGEEYVEWADREIETVIGDFSSLDTGEVNTRGAIQRVLPLIPRPSDEELQDMLTIEDAEELQQELHDRVLDGIDEGFHMRVLQAEISRIVPPWPALPAFGPNGVEGWERYQSRTHQVFDQYARHLPHPTNTDAVWQKLNAGLEQSFRDSLTNASKGMRPTEIQAQFYGQLGSVLGEAFRTLISDLEMEELIETLLERVDELMEVARKTPEEVKASDEENSPEALIYAIGAEQLENYQRAIMLSVIDAEWRQYLLAIDDLRQGIGLEAYGQRDPKIEFKRRAFEMFDKLREDVQEGIARRFFNEIPRHRQIVEEQKQREAILDRLAESGYRIQQKMSKGEGGQSRVTQTVRKDTFSNVGRNDPCPCGSGKKFKDCHYRTMQSGQQTAKPGQVKHGKTSPKRGGRRR